MNKSELKKIALKIKRIAQEVWNNMGSGFNETIYQNALAIEFRENNIEYLKEVNVEIFYKKENVGVDRPDFIITKIGVQKEPVILEIKVTDKISDDYRTQLKSYCTSLPLNNNPVLKNFYGGILLAFPKCEISICPNLKIFVVDKKFGSIIDEQKEEEERARIEKEKQKLEKKKLVR